MLEENTRETRAKSALERRVAMGLDTAAVPRDQERVDLDELLDGDDESGEQDEE